MKEKGRQHPLVKTQYFNEEIDAVGGMFNAGRMALMVSDEPYAQGSRRHESPGLAAAAGSGPASGTVNAGRMALMSSDSLSTKDTKEEQRQDFNAKDAKNAKGENFVGGPAPDDGSRRLMSPGSTTAAAGSGAATGVYAFLIDVAGMDEVALNMDGIGNAGRDATTLSIVEIDLSTLSTLQAPTYRVVRREAWTGINHLTVFGKLQALAEQWRPQHIVVDATGVGEGLWAMLDKAFRTRVIPVKFSQQEKSEIGWRFLSIIETGRFRDCAPSETVRMQYAMCRSEILPGPAKTLRWGVPDGTRGPDGELVHDDFVVADSLVAKLDELEWQVHSETLVIQGRDPLEEMSRIR